MYAEKHSCVVVASHASATGGVIVGQVNSFKRKPCKFTFYRVKLMANRFPESMIIFPNPEPVSVRWNIIPCNSVFSKIIFKNINNITRAVNFIDIWISKSNPEMVFNRVIGYWWIINKRTWNSCAGVLSCCRIESFNNIGITSVDICPVKCQVAPAPCWRWALLMAGNIVPVCIEFIHIVKIWRCICRSCNPEIFSVKFHANTSLVTWARAYNSSKHRPAACCNNSCHSGYRRIVLCNCIYKRSVNSVRCDKKRNFNMNGKRSRLIVVNETGCCRAGYFPFIAFIYQVKSIVGINFVFKS